jgi:integrase/recombinase XerD
MDDPNSAIIQLPTPRAGDRTSVSVVQGYVSTLQSAQSRRTAEESLRRILRGLGAECAPEEFPWHMLTFENFMLIRALLARDHAPTTANLSLSALRQMLKIAFVRGYITEQQRAALDLVKNVKGSRLVRGQEIAGADLDHLWGYLLGLTGPLGAMARAIFTVLLGAGARREEVCVLQLGSLRGTELHILGKGNKERALPVDRWMRPHLETWLDLREPMDLTHRLCFYTARHSRNGTGQPLRPWTLWREVERWAERSGVVDDSGRAAIRPHDFRRTFACRLLDRDFDLTEVQRLLGHESVATTQRYDVRSGRRLTDKRLATPVFEFGAASVVARDERPEGLQ